MTTTATTPPETRTPKSSLRLRLVSLARVPVQWACYGQDRSGGYHADFARLVRLHLVDHDGREHEARLSPAEARELGERLIAQADTLDAVNLRHGNGTLVERKAV
jgi:hypothetical protein